MGGAPLTHEHIFVYGHIRAGRAAVDKTRMIKLMAEAVGAAARIERALGCGSWAPAFAKAGPENPR